MNVRNSVLKLFLKILDKIENIEISMLLWKRKNIRNEEYMTLDEFEKTI